MLDPKLLRNDPHGLADTLRVRRGFALDAEAIAALETRRKALQIRTQDLQSQRKSKSKAFGLLKAQGVDITANLTEVAGLGDEVAQAEQELADLLAQVDAIALTLPNLPDETVPAGKGEADNLELARWGAVPTFDFPIQDHVALGAAGGLLDAEAAGTLSGARFTVLRGNLARLHRALGQFMLDLHVDQHGYEETNVPVIVNAKSLRGTGQLPKFEDDLFALAVDDTRRYLIPTAEVPLTNLVRDTILEPANLPRRMVAHSLCFRAEAGSGGRDVRGMIRQHQFEKVELVSVTRAQDSDAEHERMTQCAEAVLRALELPYRKILLCTGDMGFGARKTYDLEVWLPSQDAYREISSCSNCGDFQARRMLARTRDPETDKIELVHTLNGSGVAVGRALIALMENHQQADGSLAIPAALRPYLGGAQRLALR
jgi:seryl-tRNA synthetase